MSSTWKTVTGNSFTYSSGPSDYFGVSNTIRFRRNPLKFLTQCTQKYGNLVYLRFGKSSYYLVNHPQLIEEVLVHRSSQLTKLHFGSVMDFIFGNGLVTSEGEFWQQQRRTIQPIFYHQRLVAYGDRMVAYTDSLLKTWRNGEVRDVCQDMQHLALEIVAKFLFAADSANQAKRLSTIIALSTQSFDLSHRLNYSWSPWLLTLGKQKFRRTIAQLNSTIYQAIEQRRASQTDRGDLLSLLLSHSEGNNEHFNKQLRDELVTLMIAGRDTVSMALSWMWYLLSQHPQVEAKLMAELKQVLGERAPTVADIPQLVYAQKIIKETLRLYPPDWYLWRKVVRESEIAGSPLPVGSDLLILIWGMQRDRRFFDSPEKFIPERWTEQFAKQLPKFAYFPFGGGPRGCIGQSLAMMEAVLVLTTIAQKYRLTLAQQSVELQAAVTLRPKSGLKMVITKR